MVNHWNRSAYDFSGGFHMAGKPNKEKTCWLLSVLYLGYHMAVIWPCHRNHRFMDAWINLHDNQPFPSKRVEKESSALVRLHRRRKKIQAHCYNRINHYVCSWDCGLLHSFERDNLRLFGKTFEINIPNNQTIEENETYNIKLHSSYRTGWGRNICGKSAGYLWLSYPR